MALHLEQAHPGWRVEYRARTGLYAAQVEGAPDTPVYVGATLWELSFQMAQHDELRHGIRTLLSL